MQRLVSDAQQKSRSVLPVAVHDRVDAVSYCQHCAVGEFLSYCLLYQFIGFHVNRCCSFIENKNLRLAKQRSSQTD